MKYFDKSANTIFIHICKNIDFNSNVQYIVILFLK